MGRRKKAPSNPAAPKSVVSTKSTPAVTPKSPGDMAGSVDSAERRYGYADHTILDMIKEWKKERIKGNDLLTNFRQMISARDIDHAHVLNIRDLMNFFIQSGIETDLNDASCIKTRVKKLLREDGSEEQRSDHNFSKSDFKDEDNSQYEETKAIDRLKKEHSDDSKKHGGNLNENMVTFIRGYKQSCEDLKAPEHKRVDMMHCAMKGIAKEHFYDHIKEKGHDFEGALEALKKRHMTAERHQALVRRFNGLKFQNIRKSGMSKSEALDKLYNALVDLQKQLGGDYNGQTILLDRLTQAVEKEDFKSALKFNPPQDPESALVRLHMGISQDEDQEPSKDDYGKDQFIRYAQQAFGNPKRGRKKKSYGKHRGHSCKDGDKRKYSKGRDKVNIDKFGRRGKNPIGKHGHILLCHECGSADHFAPDCPDCDNEAKIQHVRDVVRQHEPLGINFAQGYDSGSAKGDSGSDSDSSSANESDGHCDDVEARYMNMLEQELSGRVDLHGMMGAQEVLYSSNQTEDPFGFKGICIDPGAQFSMGGISQYHAYLKHARSPIVSLKPTKMRARGVGGGVSQALGIATIRFPVADQGHFYEFECMIIDSDDPILLGGNESFSSSLDMLASAHELAAKDWRIPIAWGGKHWHYHFPEGEILFTETEVQNIMLAKKELEALHKKFGRAQADKLYNLMRKAGKDVTTEDLKMLKEIGRECFPCQRHAKSPMRYMAAIPKDIIFNHELIMDIMHIEGKPVLHIICAGARFSVASFLPDISAETIWSAFIRLWLHPYVGAPHILRIDQGSQFASADFIKSCKSIGIFVNDIPVESPNSMGIGERHHDPPRRIFRKIKMETPNLQDDLILSSAYSSMNDAMGPEGCAPTLLVHGMLPRIPIGDNTTSTLCQAERMKALSVARSEMEVIVAKLRVKMAESHALPATLLDADASPGMLVLAYRKNSKLWEGPFELIKIEDKVAFVKIREGFMQQFSVTKVKPFCVSEDDALSTGDSDAEDPQTAGGAEQSNTPYNEIFYHKALSHKEITPEAQEQFKPAIKQEMEGLLNKGAFKKVRRSTLPRGANMLSSKLALSIKNVGARKERNKARLVALGHRDDLKDYIVSDAPTLMRYAMRAISCLASCCDLGIYSRDVKQACLQADAPFQRDLCIMPPKGCEEDGSDYVLKVMKPLYGIAESGSYWLGAYLTFFKEDMEMEPCILDPCFLFRKRGKKLDGVIGIIVDDTIGAGAPQFIAEEDKKCLKLKMNPKETKDFEFSGMHFLQQGSVASMGQDDYISKIPKLKSLKPDMKIFTALRGKLSWCARSARPDISYHVAKLAQVMPANITAEDMKLLKKAINIVKKKKIRLSCPKLDLKTARLAIYSDAGFAANADSSSQLGFVVVLVDDSKKRCALRWNSCKSQRAMRSALGAEACAFCDAMGIGASFQISLRPLLSRILPARMHADSKSLFDAITKRSQTREKRLLIDLAAAREACQRKEIANAGWARSENNLADPMTKAVKNAVLDTALEQGILEHPVEQWIIR